MLKKIILPFAFLGLIVALSFYLFFAKKQELPLKTQKSLSMLKITSPVVREGAFIPKKYTCDGEDVNPPLVIKGVPKKSKSLVLILDDPDAPVGVWNHWLVFNINPAVRAIEENSTPENALLGTNDFGKADYGGPCPHSGSHRYFFKIYALDISLNLPSGVKRESLEKEMQGHILDRGELMGKYKRE